MKKIFVLAIFLLAAASGCETPQKAPPQEPAVEKKTETKEEPKPEAPTTTRDFHKSTESRVVAFADVHGDLQALRSILRATKLVDENDSWIGGDTILVQTGDLLDRGPDERAVVDLMLKLAKEAEAAGGGIIQLNGNHEIMNVMGDLRYIPSKGFEDFQDIPGEVPNVPEVARGRVAAWLPAGPYAKALATHGVIAGVNNALFVHGGVSMQVVRYGIDRLNSETLAWMRGVAPAPPQLLLAQDGPIWSRRYSEPEPSKSACDELGNVLDTLGLKIMVVGHTVQKNGATQACGGRVWRIDTGMSAHYGGKPHALDFSTDPPSVIVAE